MILKVLQVRPRITFGQSKQLRFNFSIELFLPVVDQGFNRTFPFSVDLMLEWRDFKVPFGFRVEGQVLVADVTIISVLLDLDLSQIWILTLLQDHYSISFLR